MKYLREEFQYIGKQSKGKVILKDNEGTLIKNSVELS